MSDELIKDRMRHLDNEIAASESRARRAWDAMRALILEKGQTADRAHEAVTALHNLTADEQRRVSAFYYEWQARTSG